MLPYRLTICGVTELPEAAALAPSHAISILDPETPVPQPLRTLPDLVRHDLRFHDDIAERPDRQAPTAADVNRLLEIGEALRGEAVEHLLVHCWAGVSRSTAMAIALMAQAAPGREDEIPDTLLATRSPAWPNSVIVEIADAALGAGGRLIAAKEEIFRRVIRAHPHMAETMRGYDRGHEVPEV